MNNLPTEKGEAINYAVQMLRQAKGGMVMSVMKAGEILKWVRDEKLWQGQWESFDNPLHHNFVSECFGEKSTAHAYIQVFEKFGKIKQELLEEAGWSKLALVAPRVKEESDAVEWAEKAAALTVSDLKTEIAKDRSGVEPSTCEHEDRIIRECKNCKRKIVEN